MRLRTRVFRAKEEWNTTALSNVNMKGYTRAILNAQELHSCILKVFKKM